MPRSGPLAADGHVVVVGAGIGGLRCCEALRTHGFSGGITLVGDEPHPPYDRPPLTKQFLSGEWDLPRVTLAGPERLEALGVAHVRGVPATALDAAARVVTLADGRELAGDAVAIATGASPRWLPGTEGAAGVHVVRTLEQSTALRDELRELAPGGEVVVIGGGFIGAEVAATAAHLGLRSTILELLEVPLSPVVGEEVGRWLVELHREAGVEVRTGVGVTAVHGAADGASPSVELSTGEVLGAGVVVIGVGVRPTTSWLEGSGLELHDGVVCDAALFAAEGVVALGDLARFEWHHGPLVEQVRIEHWEVASQQGQHAAASLLAGRANAEPVELVPYFWSDQHGRKLQMLGRPDGTDDWTHVAGSPEEGRFTVLYHRGGHLTGVLGLASPRNVMRCRDAVARFAPVGEALELFA